MGFGHRVYHNYDPRGKIIKQLAYEVFEVTGKNPLIDIALELERIALEDDYFVKRKLYPNVDFYSGIIYQAMGFPVAMFPVLFAIPRTSGWMAQWAEGVRDPEQKIARPRQLYIGEGPRDWLPIESRPAAVHARRRRQRNHLGPPPSSTPASRGGGRPRGGARRGNSVPGFSAARPLTLRPLPSD